jgi:hypothetical protein
MSVKLTQAGPSLEAGHHYILGESRFRSEKISVLVPMINSTYNS